METTFTKTIELFPKHTKELLPVTFSVPPGTSLIGIRFRYSPMEVDDLELARNLIEDKLQSYARECAKTDLIPPAVAEYWQERLDPERFLPLRNLLNFSLYDPEGSFIGRWDSPQYFDKWMTIGRETSRGFLVRPLLPGQWTLELEVHALLSEKVVATLDFSLDVCTEKRWFAGEMHTHTNNSDGKASLAEVIDKAGEKGLDFLVLSDHNTTAAYPDIPKEGSPLIIPGLEWTTFHGHSVAVGIKEYIDWRTAGRGDDLSLKIEEIRRQGGLFSVAHPFVIGDPLCTGCEWEYSNLDPAYIDTLEIWSGSWREGAVFNWRAIAWWNQLLEQGFRITGVAARDMHRLNQFDLDDAANTYVRAFNCTQPEILAGLKRGDVQVSLGPLLLVTLRADGKEYSLGDTVPISKGKEIVLEIDCDSLPEDGLLQVIADGEKVYEKRTDGKSSWKIQLEAVQRWCRVQVHRDNPTFAPIVITNCIYFADSPE